MCEVRRVFHNEISDLGEPGNSSRSNKPSVLIYQPPNVHIYQASDEEEHYEESENAKEKSAETDEEESNNDQDTSIKKKEERKSIHQKNEFSAPKLLTSLKILEDIRNISNPRRQKKTLKKTNKPHVTTKASKKVNIPFEEQVYKGLIELQVNDEDLGLRKCVPLKPKEFIKNKEPEPVLTDYYKPTFDKEYVIKPGVPKFEITPVIITEIPSVLAAMKRWEPEES